MKQVDFYEVEVKYSGDINEYTPEQLRDKAFIKMSQCGDFTPVRTLNFSDDIAKTLDGAVKISNIPANKICVVVFSYIRDYDNFEEV